MKRKAPAATPPAPAPAFLVLVHAGCGLHAREDEPALRFSLRRACLAAAGVLLGDSAASAAGDAVVAAISCLEDDDVCNAGNGSNLTEDGTVEADASIAGAGLNLRPAPDSPPTSDGDGSYGAVGCAPGLAHPIAAAARILAESRGGRLGSLGRVPPTFLAGDAARRWCLARGMPAAATAGDVAGWHVTPAARRRWEAAKAAVATAPGRVDTVGALVVDWRGRVAAGVSSGGVEHKTPGRVGHAAIQGAGCWARDGRVGGGMAAAVSATGTGERLAAVGLAGVAGAAMVGGSVARDACCEALGRVLAGPPPRGAGIAAARVVVGPRGVTVDAAVAHTAESMAVGVWRGGRPGPEVHFLRCAVAATDGPGGGELPGMGLAAEWALPEMPQL